MDGRDVINTLMELTGHAKLTPFLESVGLRSKQPQYSKWMKRDQASIDPDNVIPLAKRFKIDLLAFYDRAAAGRAVRDLKKLPPESVQAAVVQLPAAQPNWPFAQGVLDQIGRLSPADQAAIEVALTMTVSAMAARKARASKGGGRNGTTGTNAP